jgi:DNA-binding HxlR family transcriptional regulator
MHRDLWFRGDPVVRPMGAIREGFMRRSSIAHLDCSIARALEVVGEWWTPMIVREVFAGKHRFSEIQRDLGIAKNILSDRLNTLVKHDVLVRKRDSSGRYPEYHLTAKGKELLPFLVALMNWGERWESGAADKSQMICDIDTGATIEAVVVDGRSGRTICSGQVTLSEKVQSRPVTVGRPMPSKVAYINQKSGAQRLA